MLSIILFSYIFIQVEKQIPTQGEYMETLSERYDIVLSRCEGFLNIIEKE